MVLLTSPHTTLSADLSSPPRFLAFSLSSPSVALTIFSRAFLQLYVTRLRQADGDRAPEGLKDGVDAGEERGGAQPVHEGAPGEPPRRALGLLLRPRAAQHEGLAGCHMFNVKQVILSH